MGRKKNYEWMGKVDPHCTKHVLREAVHSSLGKIGISGVFIILLMTLDKVYIPQIIVTIY